MADKKLGRSKDLLTPGLLNIGRIALPGENFVQVLVSELLKLLKDHQK